MKILVTGGAGFIGSHLSERLLHEGHQVTVIDDLSTGSTDNLAAIRSHKHFRFVNDTVRNAQTMHVLIEQVDMIYHLAAAVGVQLTVEQPVRTIETNVHGTETVLQIANTFGTPVLLASSSDVYGKSTDTPFREDGDSVLGPTKFARWAYACSKAIDEYLALAYYDQYQLPVVVARFFNTVGPRQTGQYGMVVPRFVRQALANEPITIYGDGTQTRCFGYVDDVVSGAIALMNCPQAPGKVFNIGSTDEISIESLADRIIEKTNSASKKIFMTHEQAFGKPSDDMHRRVPCLDRIHSMVGYEHTTTLDAILDAVIADRKEKGAGQL